MITLKQALFLGILSTIQAATLTDKKSATQQKRALDYNYPFPIISFQEQPQKFYVETIKSVSPLGQRYLPPTGPTVALPALSSANSPPVSVSFNAFEPEQQQKPSPAKPTSAAVTPVSASAAQSSTSTTQTKKRPGGLGSFKYYGGSGSSSNSKSESSSGTAAPASPTATSAPKPVKAETAATPQEKQPAKPAAKPASKNSGYDYPSPKNNRKPSKKEQKAVDSKPEESGYHYEVGLPSSDVHGVLSGASSGSSAGGMGLSYMRQSSPYYSFHVMLD